jgi:hypothetical protein
MLMIPTYCEYIRQFVCSRGAADAPLAGEHHFVAAYLVPKLYSICAVVPDYINPDGTKAILGDVVYYRDGLHHFGIEVKLGTVRLTVREFNEWIVQDESGGSWPDLFVGVCRDGLGLAKWAKFREAYVSAVKDKRHDWSPLEIQAGYGPAKDVCQLRPYMADAWFPFDEGAERDSFHEANFTNALRALVGGRLASSL